MKIIKFAISAIWLTFQQILKIKILQSLWFIMDAQENNEIDEQNQEQQQQLRRRHDYIYNYDDNEHRELMEVDMREENRVHEPEEEDETVEENAEEDEMEDVNEGEDADYDWTTSSSETYYSDDDPIDKRAAMHSLIFETTKKRTRQKPLYKFKPLHLKKVTYKLRNVLNTYPSARSGHRIIANESNLYALGGYNPGPGVPLHRRGGCALFQELWCYNFASNRWTLMLQGGRKSIMPREMASNALTIYKNLLISHGGTGFPFGEICLNDCFIYSTNPANPSITKLPVSGELPTPGYGPAIVIHDNYLYTIGGTTGFEYSCDVFRLNLDTKVWEAVYFSRPDCRDDPCGRYRHEIVYDGAYIYVLGGGTSSVVYDLQKIPAFDLKTNKWVFFQTYPDNSKAQETDGGYPKPRKCFTCVQNTTDNGDIEAFITGGMQVCAADYSVYFSDIWKLNLRTKQWTFISTASLPRPFYFHAAAASNNGCMYVFGGIEYDDKELNRRNDLYKMWMKVPKLSEMCWDALTYYNEDLLNWGTDKLLKSGIPKHFVERLNLTT